MKPVIDVRDMHTAIHSLYLVQRKPKTVLKAFRDIEAGADPMSAGDDWEIIDANTENLGEINYRNIQGQRVWHNRELVSNNIYDDGTNKYKLIGSFDLY